MPSKRAAPAVDDAVVEASASSSLRAAPRQKLHNGHVRSRPRTDEGRELSITPEGEESAFPSTQFQLGQESNVDEYHRKRDDFSAVPEEVDVQRMEKATQQIQAHLNVNSDEPAKPNECGIIESVTCNNFMCHNKLHINMGPLINFIIGHNGSGKSASLTALTLCLGGKATSTNRGQSLKSFVKEGSEAAILTVKIKNQGHGAYKRDTYGDSIVIERHFNVQGSSSFKIKNAQGRLVTTKRSELDDISDFYALQLDNPVNVLTQDMARSFLNSSSPSEKYRFFMKGVQLEQLDQDYSIMSDMLDRCAIQLEDVKADCAAVHEKYQVAKKRFELSERQQSIRQTVQQLRRQMAWSQVVEQEDILVTREQELGQAQSKAQELENNVQMYDERVEEAKTTIDEANETKAQRLEEKDTFESSYAEIKEKQMESKRQLHEILVEQRDAKQRLKQTEQAIKELERNRDEELEKLDNDGAEAAKRQEILQAEEDAETARQAQSSHGDDSELQRDKAEMQRLVLQANERRKEKKQDVDAVRARIEALRNDRQNPYAAFHPSLKNLHRAMDQEKRWGAKPIGPLGFHVRLLKPEWGSIIERTLGGILNSFVVTSKSDQALLSDMMKRVGWQGGILVGSRTTLQRLNEPGEQYTTILRALEIENPLVRDQLIINNLIEQTVLMENPDEALMFQRKSPAHVKATIAMNPNDHATGIRYSSGRGGSERSDTIQAWDRPPRMMADTEAQIEIQNDRLQTLRSALKEAEDHLHEREGHLARASQAVVRHGRDLKALRTATQSAENRIEELNDELNALAVPDGRVDQIRELLAEKQEALTMGQNQLSGINERREDLALECSEIQDQCNKANALVETKEREIADAEARVKKFADRHVRLRREANDAHEAVAAAKDAVEDAQRERDDMVEQVRLFHEAASQISERVNIPPRETPRTLENRLNKMIAQQREYEKRLGDDEQTIANDFQAAKAARDLKEEQYHRTHELFTSLKRALDERVIRWHSFRSQITIRARSMFSLLLAERGFRGKMKVNHQRKMLDLHVEVDKDAQRSSTVGSRLDSTSAHRHNTPSSRNADSVSTNSHAKDNTATKTLSGGEKSFATICMLLALWDAMGSPIRCLDEFDVFMDAVNREMAMRMIIAAARASPGRQYVLITPQSMGNVTPGPDCKIIRMSDPERGQTTLNIPGA